MFSRFVKHFVSCHIYIWCFACYKAQAIWPEVASDNLQARQYQSKKPASRRVSGFSLLELLFAVLIISLSLGVVAPSLQNYIVKSRTISQVNGLSALFNQAKLRSINSRTELRICPTSDYSRCSIDWRQAIMVFVDSNHNQKRDERETLVFSLEKSHPSVNRIGPKRSITFHDTGITSSPATILLCPTHKDSEQSIAMRGVFVSLQGQIRSSKDWDKDGIHEHKKGKPLVCPI